MRALAALCSLLIAGCAAPEEPAARVSTAIVARKAHPAVVLIRAPRACSGVLVASNVVLTARHCVAALDDELVRCGENVLGRSRISAVSDVPESVIVTVDDGKGTPLDLRVAAIHAPADDVVCDADIAVLVLRENVPSAVAMPAPMRLDVGTIGGERLTVVGFGEMPDGTNAGVRHSRDVDVERVGPARRDGVRPTLGAHEIETNLGFCQGDSGGPALDPTTGAVVAIVSRNQRSCTVDHGYVFTLISGFRTMIEQAFAKANARMTLDDSGYADEPPTRAVGNECSTAEDCASGICVSDLGAKYCTRACHPVPDACPPDWTCNGVVDTPSQVCSRGIAPKIDAKPRSVRLDAGEGHSAAACSVSSTARATATRRAPQAAFIAVILLACLCLATRRRDGARPWD